jgi:hypothetical protein
MINNNINFKWRDTYSSLLIAIISFCLLVPFSRIDFDFHHDGYILGQVIGLSDGFLIHKDIFAQYGPLAPYLLKQFLYLPFSPALNLRIGAILLIALTAFFISHLGAKKVHSFPLSQNGCHLVAILWILVCDAWWGPALLPWPSLISLFLTVTGFYFLHRAYFYLLVEKIKISIIYSATAGVCFGMITFVRIQVGLIILFFFIIALSINKVNKYKELKVYITLNITMFITIILFLLHLIQKKIIVDFFNQSVILASQYVVSGSNGSVLGKYLNIFSQLIYDSLQLLGLFLIFVFVTYLLSRFRISIYYKLIIVFLVMFFSLFISSRTNYKNIFLPQGGMRNLFPFYESVAFVMMLMFIVTFLGFIWSIFKLLQRSKVTYFPLLFVISFLSLSGISQTISFIETRHIWWGLPFSLILAFVLIEKIKIPYENLIVVIFIPILIFDLNFGLRKLNQDRVLAGNDSIIKGMYIESNALNSFYKDRDLISKYSTKSDKITYLTDDGYLSVITGHYNSVSPYFVTLLYASVDYSSVIRKSNLIVAEKSWLTEMNFDISNEFQGLGNILVIKIAENSNIVIYSVGKNLTN